MSHIKLENLIDMSTFEEILVNFSKVTKMAAVAVDYKGEPITKYSNFTKFCTKFREDHKCLSSCYRSDAHGGVEAARSGQPYIYTCHSGLTDIAVPIIENGQYLGAILAGQVIVRDHEFPATKYIPDSYIGEKLEQVELKMLKQEVPVISKQQLEDSANLLYIMANYIVEKAMRSHRFLKICLDNHMCKT